MFDNYNPEQDPPGQEETSTFVDSGAREGGVLSASHGRSGPLDDGGDALSKSDTHGREAIASLAALHLV
jgi:hypothetical protein